MKYIFILGRNPELSEAEIFSYFEREGIKRLNHKLRTNALLVEIDRELNLKKLIDELGGTIAIGKVILSGKADNIIKEIAKKPIYLGRDNKVVYSVLDYADEKIFSDILEAMKGNFRNERLKARYKGVSGTIKLQSGKVMHGSPEKILLRDMNYFAFEDKDNKELSFGFLEESYDSSENEKKDMEKPYRRESLAISPRLAKILINLSQVKERETLVDPFCGIGVILGEALLKNINIVGADIDEEAIKNARKNLEWLKHNFKSDADYLLINRDSRKIKVNEFSGIATEPHLGDLLKSPPSREKAQQMINNFENLMIDVLNNLKTKLKNNGKIVFTSPLIKSQAGKVGCDIENICDNTGLSVYDFGVSDVRFPIQEFREGQIVGREIFVLEV